MTRIELATTAWKAVVLPLGIVLAAVVGVVIIGGQRRITAIAELLVPFMAVVYILGSLVIIYMFADQLPHVVRTIFQDAFSMKSAAGGAAGTVMNMPFAMVLLVVCFRMRLVWVQHLMLTLWLC